MKKDKTENSGSAKTVEDFSFSRRDFLKTVGGGIIIFFFAGSLPAQERSGSRPAGQALPADFNAFLRIGADGRVTCFTGKIEMGQGARSEITQAAAEELRVAPTQINLIMGDTALVPDDAHDLAQRLLSLNIEVVGYSHVDDHADLWRALRFFSDDRRQERQRRALARAEATPPADGGLSRFVAFAYAQVQAADRRQPRHRPAERGGEDDAAR